MAVSNRVPPNGAPVRPTAFPSPLRWRSRCRPALRPRELKAPTGPFRVGTIRVIAVDSSRAEL